MAGGLIEIKTRIKSVTSTQKITKAMGLVATSKLRKTRIKMEMNDKYNSYFNAVIKEVIDNFPSDINNIYTHGNGSKKKLYIVLTSDSGLCGGFNATVVGEAAQRMDNDRENSLLMLVGDKGRSYFKRYKFESVAEYVDIPDIPSVKEAHTITNHVLEMYDKGEIGEVYVTFTRFESTIKQIVEYKKLLPLGFNKDEIMRDYVELEPGFEQFINETIRLNLSQQILNCMLNSKASEQGARMSAMDGATRNANDILEKLKLKYNRIRQSAITQEITEIIGGAEAQN